MVSVSLRSLGATTAGRLYLAFAGSAPLLVALYKAPQWLETWKPYAIGCLVAAAAAFLGVAAAIAVRGSAATVKRVALELSALGCALLAAEAVLLAHAPETWTDDPLVRRMIVREQAALEQGVEYDARLRADIVRDLRSRGMDAVPGFGQVVGSAAGVSAAIRTRGLLPLSNASNALVVECNEGKGFLVFRADELGFNNPRGVVSASVDVAVIGESLALGHCVPAGKSAVDLIRRHFPRTANFGAAGSRVLAQVGVFREYVAPRKPPVVVWFVNTNFAEPRDEADQPVLVKYLNDPSFSQGLRKRQDEVDSFVREVLLPLNIQRDDGIRTEIARARMFPFERLIKLPDIRGLVDLPAAMRQPLAAPDLSYFERAVRLVADSAREWGGRVVVVILPSYEISIERSRSVDRYEAVLRAVDGSMVSIVDGAALFAAYPDVRSLYALRTNNHPSEEGHALLADAVIAAIERDLPYEPPRDYTAH